MKASNRPPGAISLSAYATLRGVSYPAVKQRIDAGSLPTSAKRIKGHWLIIDVERANAEWEANTRPYISGGGQGPGHGNGQPPSALSEATLRERRARAEAIELEVARKTKALVPARDVELRWSALVVGARTRLLGLPSRAKGRLPHLSAGDLVVLEALIREALEELGNEEEEDL